jgi:hypothetical protein
LPELSGTHETAGLREVWQRQFAKLCLTSIPECRFSLVKMQARQPAKHICLTLSPPQKKRG